LSTILVTGATDGLGRALARELVARDHDVLVHGRSQQRIDATLAGLDSSRARGYRADLSSLAAVRGLAGDVREREERLDVLVNNAGIGAHGPREESGDGLELRFAVNYLAGYLLTRELLDLLRASAPARIVNVASAGQQALDFADLQLERDYSGVRAYCQSKLAQILFTIDLAAELEGSGVTVTALHPATYMPTKIVQSPISTLQEGVDATLRLVAAPELDGVSGAYFNGQSEARADPQAYDPDARRALREASEALTRID
jgi:NAD(P)-dependent dehydrogenase (short-subunit alcohol dehydrogenase family)